MRFYDHSMGLDETDPDAILKVGGHYLYDTDRCHVFTTYMMEIDDEETRKANYEIIKILKGTIIARKKCDI